MQLFIISPVFYSSRSSSFPFYLSGNFGNPEENFNFHVVCLQHLIFFSEPMKRWQFLHVRYEGKLPPDRYFLTQDPVRFNEIENTQQISPLVSEFLPEIGGVEAVPE